MSYRRLGLKALGLCLVAALATMAFAASAAQGTWFVEGVAFPAGLKPTITGHELGNFLTLAVVGGIKVEIHCELLKVEGVIQEPLDGHATFRLSKNCKTFLNLAESVNCKPLPETIATVLFKLFKHNGATYILFTPLTAPNFAIIHLGLDPGTCVLGLNISITGSFVAECLLIACNTNAVEHRISVVLPGLFPGHELKFGANPKSLHGAITLKLSGAHANKGWSGLG